MKVDSLVIFKNQPARIIDTCNRKVSIQLKNKKVIKLSSNKDLLLLHSGEFKSFDMISNMDDGLNEDEIIESWLLLQGYETIYSELSELIYGEYNCTTVYKTWQIVKEGLFFFEKENKIIPNAPEIVEKIRKQKDMQVRKNLALNRFIRRSKEKTYSEEDLPFIKELVSYALGKSKNCRLFKFMKIEKTLTNAHKWLLDIGFWNEFINPYPIRLKINVVPPNFPIPRQNSGGTRTDLTHLTSYAIDDKDIYDPDDALSFDDSEQKLWVHIADPACIVTPGSDIDNEARSRACSLYLPEGITPMLPNEVINNFALGSQSESPALSIGFRLSNGQIKDIEILLSTIKVTRLSYEQAEFRLHEKPFNAFVRFSNEFSSYRQQNGSVDLQFPEIKIRLCNSKVLITQLETLQSRNIVRNAMLMAGNALAIFSKKHNIPLPFSTQPEHNLIEWKQKPQSLSSMFLVKKMLKKGQYKITAEKHAGLGLDAYIQGTSPLRRYLDLVVHQQLRRFLRSKPLFTEEEITVRIHASETGRKIIRQCENLSHNHWKCVFLKQNISWEGKGIVVERHSGNQVSIFIPGLSLTKKIMPTRALKLDDSVSLILSNVKLEAQEIYFWVKENKYVTN